MANQNRISGTSNLLDKDGNLIEAGWGTKPSLKYNKNDIKHKRWRLKEWDHYSILNKDFGIQITIGDIYYLTQMSYVWLDFTKKERNGQSIMKFFTKSKILPLSSLEDSYIEFPTDKFKATLKKKGHKRILTIDDPTFIEKGIKGSITLEDNPKVDNTVVVTGYGHKKPKLFYYNHKINYMPAKGTIQLGNEDYNFEPQSSFGLMDWGRGIWPYKTHWLWGSACGLVDGKPVAFNIGYGFGDLSTHTENIVFYDGKAHKIDEVTFHHENDRDPTQPWKFTSYDNRFNMILEPIIPHREKINFGLIYLNSSLLHGLYSGEIVLDTGEKIQVKGMLGHAEDIYWRW